MSTTVMDVGVPLPIIWEKANQDRDCLAEQRTSTGQRRSLIDEDPLFVIDPFVADEAKILSTKAWRAMSDKTQVFTQPRNCLVRTRASHVTEVVGISVITAEMLGLNPNLVRAAALMHDIGHVPFGHQGEHWFQKVMEKPEFCHEKMGPIILQKIERAGDGINATHETLESGMRHSGDMAKAGMLPEAWVLRYCDKFAYIFHDVNDIFDRMDYPMPEELRKLISKFGETQRERVSTAIAALVIESSGCGRVSFEHSELAKDFTQIRKLMYGIYPAVTRQDVNEIMEPVLEFIDSLKLGCDPFLILSLMTDKDVLTLREKGMRNYDDFRRTAIHEIVEHLDRIGEVDLCNPGLDW